MSRRFLVAVLGLAACHPTSKPDDPEPRDRSGVSTSTDGSKTSDPTRTPGASHTANIDLVALSADGKAALTRDQIGGVRLWPRLDGTREPVLVPVRGALTMSVAPRKGGGHLAVIVEPSGGAKVFGIDDGGKTTELVALPPFEPLFDARALPDGESVLTLYRDHSLRLLSPQGKELTRLEEKRSRPTELRVQADGKGFATITRAGNSIEIQRGTITAGDKPKLARRGDARTINPATAGAAMALSPNGDSVAAVDKVADNVAWEILVTGTDKDAKETRVRVPVPAHVNPNVGFASDHQLLVTTHDGSLSWLVDVRDGKVRARAPGPQEFVTQGRGVAVAADTMVAAYGTWVYVQHLEERRQRFLGYRAQQAQSVAISPDDTHVAWAYAAGPVLIESIDGSGSAVSIDTEPNFGAFRVRFVDADHLITVDSLGGVRLFEWRTRKLLDHAGVNGSIRNVLFDADSGLLLIERHTNDAAVFEVDKDSCTGPYIIADQSFRSGLLSPRAKGPKSPVLWTLDGSNRLREYSLTDLKSDLDRTEIERMGEPLAPGKVAPLAIDRHGRHYGVRWNGSAMEFFVDHGKHLRTARAEAGDVNQIVPSPDGKYFVAVHQRGQVTALSMYDSDSLEEKWSYSTAIFANEIVWSEKARFVGVASNTGAVVLDAADGKPKRKRCGIQFEASGSPPPNPFNGMGVHSICES